MMTVALDETNDTSSLTYLPLDKMAAISQTIYSEALSWMNLFLDLSSLKIVRKGSVDNNAALV